VTPERNAKTLRGSFEDLAPKKDDQVNEGEDR
jgi:hypothetical protein